MISFKSATIPKPRFGHKVYVPNFGEIQHREWHPITGWYYLCFGLYGTAWLTEGQIARGLNENYP